MITEEMVRVAFDKYYGNDVEYINDAYEIRAAITAVFAENKRLRTALEEISSTEPSGHLNFAKPKHSGYSALEIAREALKRA